MHHTWFGRVIRQIAQQVGIDPVRRVRLRRPGPLVERVHPQQSHQAAPPLDRLELTSTNPVPVLENVNTGRLRETGNFGLAANGSLVYLSGDAQAVQRTLV